MKKNQIDKLFKNKDILVTGGCGSIGSEIVRELTDYDVKRIRVLDINESGLYHLDQELKEKDNVRYFVGDVRDKERLKTAINGVDYVFHTAALKHVPLCEYNPFEAVKTNVIGTQNLISLSMENNVSKFLYLSTDKAVNPINTMGASKSLGEKLVLTGAIGDTKTKFSCIRFGNVLNSIGSVIPLFLGQIKKGGPVTLTSKEMTRFFMSIPDAINLMFQTLYLMEGREIFILKMKSMRIIDLAEILIEEISPKYGFSPKDIDIKETGIRPGERIYETLLNEEELQHTKDLQNLFKMKPGLDIPQYIIHGIKTNPPPKKEYESRHAKQLTKNQIKKLLKDNKII